MASNDSTNITKNETSIQTISQIMGKDKFTVAELKKKAKSLKIVGITKMKKAELIQNIVDTVNDYSGEQDGNDSTRRNTKEFVFITKFKKFDQFTSGVISIIEFIKENYEGFGEHIPDILETIYGSRTSIAEIKKMISDNTSSTASSTVSKKGPKRKVKIVTKGK